MRVQMGRTVGRHVLEARVLRDAVSEVWQARHSQRPNQLAHVRVIDPDVAPARSLAACLAEARASADLLHHNILRVHAVGDVGDPWVVSRYARTTPLAAALRRPLSVVDAVTLLGPLGDALDAAAEAGMAHGALHPRSIWIEDRQALGGTRRAVLSGFGLHHLLASVAAHDRRRAPLDDFLYVAPELLRGAAPTPWSDQYALAAAVHHAVAGHPPFERPTLSALFGAHLFAQPSGAGADRDATGELDAILARALAKDPDERYERCDDLVTALEAWCQATSGRPLSVARRPDGHAAPLPVPVRVRRPSHRRRRRPLRLVAASSVALVAIGLVAAVALREPAPSADAALAVTATADASPAAPVAASSAEPTASMEATGDPAVRWRTRIDDRPTALHIASAGLIVETGGRPTVVDLASGRERTELPGGGDIDTPLITASEPASEPMGLWHNEVDDQLWKGSLVAVGDGVAVASRSGTVCLRRRVDGEPLWCVPVDGVADTGPTIHDAGDRVVVITRSAVTALDARTGEQIWRQPGVWRRTVRDGERLVAVEGDGGLAVISLVTGTVRRPVDTPVGREALLAVDGDQVYVAQPDGTLLGLEVRGGL